MDHSDSLEMQFRMSKSAQVTSTGADFEFRWDWNSERRMEVNDGYSNGELSLEIC